MSIQLAEVKLWGRTIGAVSLVEGSDYTSFEYHPDFIRSSNVEVAPLMMPRKEGVYRFPNLSLNTFHGLSGLLADSLPDKFGTALIDAWLATQGRKAGSFNVLERLCYIGTRGMGALEFVPATGPGLQPSKKLEIAHLVHLASEILTNRIGLKTSFKNKEAAFNDILRISTSAGGARAKALIAWNPKTHEVRSGQLQAGDGFEQWLIKFDGVTHNRDKEGDDPKGYGAIEYAYYLMATAAGISMNECRLEEEGGRHHFMTRRFDRLPSGEKLHMQSLGALGHFDFNLPGATSYEQAFMVLRQLGLPASAREELFRRMTFNIVARNHDDHVKNTAFLMDQQGAWSLAPAFDVTYSFNPDGAWTGSHQMSMNGKRENFLKEDFEACAKNALLKRGRAAEITEKVIAAVKQWPKFAAKAKVPAVWKKLIKENHCVNIR